MTLSNPQAEKEKNERPDQDLTSLSVPFIAHHDMNDQGDLGEETTRLLGKDIARTKKTKSKLKENVNQQKGEPFAKEMGWTRILVDQG